MHFEHLTRLGAKDRRELVGRHYLQLLEGAVTRALVVAPPPKLRCVAKSAALHVVVTNLHDKLRTERLPRQVLSGAPAARHAGPSMRLGLAR